MRACTTANADIGQRTRSAIALTRTRSARLGSEILIERTVQRTSAAVAGEGAAMTNR